MNTIAPEDSWKAVLAKDGHFDGAFVYGVNSTGIYCRPSCPAKRPRRDQVRFFPMPAAAEQAGFRPCRRCHPEEATIRDPQVERVQRLCRHIESHDSAEEPLSLTAMGKLLETSPHHLQRLFKRHMGITPSQYAEAWRVRRLKERLRKGETVTRALYEAGYGSASRLYERASTRLGMSPGTYLRGGKGMHIRYGTADSALGRILVAATEKGVCAVRLGKSDAALSVSLAREYPAAEIRKDQAGLADYLDALLKHLEGRQPNLNLPLDVQVTAFQWQVYEALRGIPYGQTRSYAEVAAAIGRPRAVRAVARACAANPAALVIPCHRVIRRDGRSGGYRWGDETKQWLLDREKSANL